MQDTPGAPDHRANVAIVLPTYNEKENVRETVRRLECALRGYAWEIIFVDDDSPDGTSDLVRVIAAAGGVAIRVNRCLIECRWRFGNG